MAHLTVRPLECVFASDQFITRGGRPIYLGGRPIYLGGRPIYLGGGFQIRRSSCSDESEPCRMQKRPSNVEDVTDVVMR